MQFFEKHKALLITLLFFLILLLLLYNLHLSNSASSQQEMLIDLEQFQPKEEAKKEKSAQSSPEKNEPSPIKTHRAFNENEKARNKNFSNQLNEIFKKNSASQPENTAETQAGTSGQYSLGESATKKREASNGNNTSQASSLQKGGISNSSISFSLKGRSALTIPNPVYTCDAAGKIVVNIHVNAAGTVMETSINKASSSTSNECLEERALEYAAGATFSTLPGRNNQPGTITYQFNP